ncbi:hypothetical protein ACJX0J_015621, partial [Zea mays]
KLLAIVLTLIDDLNYKMKYDIFYLIVICIYKLLWGDWHLSCSLQEWAYFPDPIRIAHSTTRLQFIT